MTILPVKTHNQNKEDSQFQENSARDPRSSRQRPRVNRHLNNDAQRNSPEYPYWNVSYNSQSIEDANYSEMPPARNSPVPDMQVIHNQVLPETASTSADIPWRIPSPLDPVETAPCDKKAEFDQVGQNWHPSTSADIENKVLVAKSSKKSDKKVCAKRRQRRTSPYSKIRQKNTRPKSIVHSHNPEAAPTKPALVKTLKCNSLPTNNSLSSTKPDIRVFNDETLSASSQQAQSTMGEERNVSKYKPQPVEHKKEVEERQETDVNEEPKHNSDDEYDPIRLPENVDFNEIETTFEGRLKEKRGYIIKPMNEDGACLFRAVADQVYGDQNMHDIIRKHCMDYMLKNADFFKNYVTEDFNSYISRKRKNNTYGNHLEIQAMAELYNRPFEVYQYSIDPINTFHSEHNTENIPVRLSYHQNSHYNSIVDPYKATIGVGLGLPSFKPGSADENLVSTAMHASEQQLLEEQMFQDKVQATDWENTEEAVLKHVAMQSYKQYVESSIPVPKNSENKTTKEESSPNKEIKTTAIVESRPSSSTKNTNFKSATSSCMSDWVEEEEEWQVLSRVMVASQQEYIDSFKQSKPTCSKYT